MNHLHVQSLKVVADRQNWFQEFPDPIKQASNGSDG
jgi:hypothetical protein